MNKNSSNFIVTIILAYLLAFILPWYSVMIAAALTAWFIPLKKVAVVVVPFFAIFLFWVVYSFVLSSANDFILAKRIALLLPLEGNPYLLILLTGVIGGIAAGSAAIFGKQLSTVMKKT